MEGTSFTPKKPPRFLPGGEYPLNLFSIESIVLRYLVGKKAARETFKYLVKTAVSASYYIFNRHCDAPPQKCYEARPDSRQHSEHCHGGAVGKWLVT